MKVDTLLLGKTAKATPPHSPWIHRNPSTLSDQLIVGGAAGDHPELLSGTSASAVSVTKGTGRRFSVRLVVPIVAAALMVGLLIGGRYTAPASKDAARATITLPPALLPNVEPTRFQAIRPQRAIDINNAVAFSKAPNPSAAAFMFEGATDARDRAIDCLAAAAYYEAGDDTEGQRAVVQVVLNRLRHPAFPKTICGVVFQGSERSTGCQFTFTCDGSLARTPSAAGWQRAREVASQALSGAVFATVGYATHYHTDWVVPYWSAKLDKIAAVKTHLFFRWSGKWGSPSAFGGRHLGKEPDVPTLARLSQVHGELERGQPDVVSPGEADKSIAVAAARMPSTEVLLRDHDGFFVVIGGDGEADAFPQAAAMLCTGRDFCKVRGWIDRGAVPSALPISPAAQAAMSFSYLRNSSKGFEKLLWNCNQFPRADRGQCMKIPFGARAKTELAGQTIAQ